MANFFCEIFKIWFLKRIFPYSLSFPRIFLNWSFLVLLSRLHAFNFISYLKNISIPVWFSSLKTKSRKSLCQMLCSLFFNSVYSITPSQKILSRNLHSIPTSIVKITFVLAFYGDSLIPMSRMKITDLNWNGIGKKLFSDLFRLICAIQWNYNIRKEIKLQSILVFVSGIGGWVHKIRGVFRH